MLDDPYYRAVAQWAFFNELEKRAGVWKDTVAFGEDVADKTGELAQDAYDKGRKITKTLGMPEGRINKSLKALARLFGKEKEAQRKDFNKGHAKQLLKNMLVVGAGGALGTAAGHAANQAVVKGVRGLSTPWKMRATRHLPRAGAIAGGIGGILLAARRMRADQLIEEKGNERSRRIEQGKDG